MGFVGGVSNIAIATPLPPSSVVHCIVNIKCLWNFSYLIFYACLRLQFLDVQTSPGQRRPVLYSVVMCGAWPGTVALSKYDILLCSETLVLDMRHVSELLVPGYVWDGYGAFHQLKFERGYAKYCFFGVCGVRQNHCVQSLLQPLHRWLDFSLFTSINGCREGCLSVIWTAIIRNGWVLRPRTVMELQPLTLQQSPVAISWLSAQPMLVVEHLTSWWLMFLT